MSVTRWSQKIRGVFRSLDEITGQESEIIIRKLARMGDKGNNYKIYFDPQEVGRKEIRVRRIDGDSFLYTEYYPVEWKESKPQKKKLGTKIYMRAGDYSILQSVKEQVAEPITLTGMKEMSIIEQKLRNRVKGLNPEKLKEINEKLSIVLELLKQIQ